MFDLDLTLTPSEPGEILLEFLEWSLILPSEPDLLSFIKDEFLLWARFGMNILPELLDDGLWNPPLL